MPMLTVAVLVPCYWAIAIAQCMKFPVENNTTTESLFSCLGLKYFSTIQKLSRLLASFLFVFFVFSRVSSLWQCCNYHNNL